MRGLGLIDLLVIAAVVALLVFVASKDFARYAGRSAVPAAVPLPRAMQ
jgi:Tfp pilus assembly protein PilE